MFARFLTQPGLVGFESPFGTYVTDDPEADATDPNLRRQMHGGGAARRSGGRQAEIHHGHVENHAVQARPITTAVAARLAPVGGAETDLTDTESSLIGEAIDALEKYSGQYHVRDHDLSEALDAVSTFLEALALSSPEATAYRRAIVASFICYLTNRNHSSQDVLLRMVHLYVQLQPLSLDPATAKRGRLADGTLVERIARSGREDAGVLAAAFLKERYLATPEEHPVLPNGYLEALKDRFGLYSGDTFTRSASQTRFDQMIAMLVPNHVDPDPAIRDVVIVLLKTRLIKLHQALGIEQHEGFSAVDAIYEGRSLAAIWDGLVTKFQQIVPHFQDPRKMALNALKSELQRLYGWDEYSHELMAPPGQLVSDYISYFSRESTRRVLDVQQG